MCVEKETCGWTWFEGGKYSIFTKVLTGLGPVLYGWVLVHSFQKFILSISAILNYKIINILFL